MIPQFLIYFLGTGLLMRILTPPIHFTNRTVTRKIRKKTGLNVHHLHIGIMIIISCLLLLAFKGFSNLILYCGAVGLSLTADEIFIWKNIEEKYFTKKGLWYSITAHIVIGIIITALLIAF